MENCITSQKSRQLTWLKAIFGQQGIVPVKAHIWLSNISLYPILVFSLTQNREVKNYKRSCLIKDCCVLAYKTLRLARRVQMIKFTNWKVYVCMRVWEWLVKLKQSCLSICQWKKKKGWVKWRKFTWILEYLSDSLFSFFSFFNHTANFQQHIQMSNVSVIPTKSVKLLYQCNFKETSYLHASCGW